MEISQAIEIVLHLARMSSGLLEQDVYDHGHEILRGELKRQQAALEIVDNFQKALKFAENLEHSMNASRTGDGELN